MSRAHALPPAQPRRLPLAAIGVTAVAALVIGVVAGLARLAVDVPGGSRAIGLYHGALMVSGFAGTVIGLERAAAAGHPVALMGPAASAVGALALVLGAEEVAASAFLVAAVVLAVTLLRFWRLQPAPPLLVIALGAACWAGASLRWLAGGAAVEVVPWWIAFLALTIAGERLELTRFRRQPLLPFAVASVALVAGLAVTLFDRAAGARLIGAALLLTGAWLAWTDTARVTVRRGGLATYTGATLLACYVSLILAGVWLLAAPAPGTAAYDSALHLFFIGFVMGAIFAHGPIILPALTGLSIRLTALTPVAVTLLYASLALRVAGNAAGEHTWRQAAGSVHAIAFALFALGLVAGVLRARITTERPARP